MAASLAARLQRPQEIRHMYMHAAGLKELGLNKRVSGGVWGSSGVRSRAKGLSSELSGRSSRTSLFNRSSPRREAHVLAMSESESDITDMQELADGSLFFSFGGSLPPRSAAQTAAAPSSRAENAAAKADVAAHSLMTPATLPRRLPSSFRRNSPIRAARKKGSTSTEVLAPPPPRTEDGKMTTAAKDGRPPRPPSTFTKRSPIPKTRESDSVPSVEASSTLLPDGNGHDQSTDEEAAALPTVYDPAKDSPLSPALQEILNHGKETVPPEAQDSSAAAASQRKASKAAAMHAKKKTAKPSVVVANENVATVAEAASENGSASKDLASFKLAELRSLAKARGLKGYSKLKKGELVDLLNSPES